MEKKERTKYYPISLKDKKLHDEFMIELRTKGFKNVDQMIRHLLELEEKNKFLEKMCTQKENDFNELLQKRTFTQDELKALYQCTADVDLWDTEDEEFTEIIRSANTKLYRMAELLEK